MNEIFAAILITLIIAFVFARQLAAVINYVLNFGGSKTGVRIIVQKQFSDVSTGERFSVWQGAYGVRVALATFLLKF